jgi:hypothetical protein
MLLNLETRDAYKNYSKYFHTLITGKSLTNRNDRLLAELSENVFSVYLNIFVYFVNIIPFFHKMCDFHNTESEC